MTALRNPYAEWRLLGPENATGPMRGHDRVLLHTMVGYLTSTDNYFRNSNGYQYSGSESTYGLGGKWGSDVSGNLDGKLWCWTARDREADCQIEGDYNSISFECADDGSNTVKPFSDKQVETLIKAITWECSVAAHAQCPMNWRCHGVGIPAVEIPDSKAGRLGIGWHRKGCNSSPLYQSGYRQPGGELWSSSTGKICPGNDRILQIRTIIIPSVAKNLSGDSIQEEDTMEYKDWSKESKDEQIENMALWMGGVKVHGTATQERYRDSLYRLSRIEGTLGVIIDRLDKMATAAPPVSPDPQ